MKVDWTPENIQQLLDDKGWMAVDLAAALGCSQTTVYRWLRGDGGPPLWTFQRRMNAWWREIEQERERQAADV